MSIPKEPRQLMINLMYLVLTAMLALNVSAEVMNAFKVIDKSLAKSNEATNKNIDAQEKALNEILKEESKAKFRPLGKAVEEIRAEVNGFNTYIEELKHKLIDEAGDNNGTYDDGDYLYPDDPLKKVIRGKKNKDVTTRLLAQGEEGKELEQRVSDTKKKLVEIYSKVLSDPKNAENFGMVKNGKIDKDGIAKMIEDFESNMTLSIDKNWKELASPDKTSWADFRFRQMPLISALPLLTKFETDAKNAEANAVGSLASLVGGKQIVFNSFFPVVQAKKAYVIKGEKFEADISLGAYSSDIKPENVRITVNGTTVRVGNDGKAKYSTTTSNVGAKKLNLTATVTNPITGEKTTSSDTYEYEVGLRSAAVSADKMNVFYIGVDNPISVSVAGVPSSQVKVSCSGAGCTKSGKNIRVTSPGNAKITVSGGGFSQSFDYRVKRIPDPVPVLGKNKGGDIKSGIFKAQKGIIARLDNFDFEARCNIDGYKLTYVPRRADAIQVVNGGGSYTSRAKNMTSKAKPGDIYFFQDIKARCPGDKAGRNLGTLVFNIK